ncbi:MAG: D-lysine 5,6-aminomutase subunit alpha, partial [Tissierellia bacterium]|nr:D-lysine 5,6-aminomutase subunit alpha [Tissierellia bacterium]
MMSKLNLNQRLIDESRTAARNITNDVQKFIDDHTTVSTERTVVRLLGIDGIDEIERPLPNVVVENIKEGGGLERGAAYWIGNAMLNTGLSPQEIAEKIAAGDLDITRLPAADEDKIQETIYRIAKQTVDKIQGIREKRDYLIQTLSEGEKPYLYVIVATGNIYEDIVQAQAAARQGADIIL